MSNHYDRRKMMNKKFKKWLITGVAALSCMTMAFAMTSCNNTPVNPDNPDTPDADKYTVSFIVNGETISSVSVKKNKRITEQPSEATVQEKLGSDKIFTGWYLNADGTGAKWDFDTDAVTANINLYAGYRTISAAPTEVRMADEACTSKIVWTQSANPASCQVVEVLANGEEVRIDGTTSFDSENYLVTFTPNGEVAGGLKKIKITTGADSVTVENMMFGGAGTEANPYLVASEKDFTKINQANVAAGVVFKLYSNITVTGNRALQQGYVFNGILHGNGKTITLSGNCGAIYKTGESAVIDLVILTGAISTQSNDSVGALVDYNAGRLEKITTNVAVTSTAGSVGSVGIENALNESLSEGRGIAGGIVGTNDTTGVIYNSKITCSSSSDGVVKAAIGGGCIAGYNKGRIELCVSGGTLGAYNSIEVGKSMSSYSYSGGVCGINAGTITQCSLESTGKLLAQRYADAASVVAGTNNSNLGGIVGYNMQSGVVSMCSYSGLRVHGDENVGGIVGNNEGRVTDCIAEGVYKSTPKILSYVGGRINVGGIVGYSNGGTVTNCISTVNVFGYTENTAYALAPAATNSVYLSANPNASSLTTPPAPVALVAPTGEGNAAVSVEGGSFDGKTEDYLLAESYLATVNGNNAFLFNSTTIKLNVERPDEQTITVKLYNGTELWKEATVGESNTVIAGPAKTGFRFVGWALSADGEVVYTAGTGVSYYGLIDYATDGAVSLYAVFEEAEAPVYDLSVAIWGRYMTEENANALKDAYGQIVGEQVSINFVYFNDDTYHAVADFGAGVNNGVFDVIIGSGTNISTTGGVSTLAKHALDESKLTMTDTGRQAALLTDTAFARAFYAYLTGLEDVVVTITFDVDGVTTSGTVYSLIADSKYAAQAPVVTVDPETESFLGWATSADATEAQIVGTKTELYYSDIQALLSEGQTSVTLYAIIGSLVQQESVSLAVWGAYITENEATALQTAYNAVNADVKVYLTVISDSGVADFGAKVNAGAYDVIIGCGANITTKGGVSTHAKHALDYTVVNYAQTGRLAALLTETDAAKAFYSFATGVQDKGSANISTSVGGTVTLLGEVDSLYETTVALKAPEAPEGKTFLGWAFTADGTEAVLKATVTKVGYADVEAYLDKTGEVPSVTLYAVFGTASAEPEPTPAENTTLVVSVWTKNYTWITESELEAIKTGFDAYLKAQGVDTSKITITWRIETATGVTDLAASVAAAKDVDIVIGSGAKDGGLTPYKGEREDIDVSHVAEGRKFVVLKQNTLAEHLRAYLKTVKTSANTPTT